MAWHLRNLLVWVGHIDRASDFCLCVAMKNEKMISSPLHFPIQKHANNYR